MTLIFSMRQNPYKEKYVQKMRDLTINEDNRI
jgi:hypothetical protein